MTTDVVAMQQAALATLYAAHVGPGDAYALVDFPDHANVGDSAIWLGELAVLREVTGRPPVYVSTWHDFDSEAFYAACPTGTLLLHGGGNLGDIWPHHQHFREHVLAEVRDRPVVQLPQSIHFRDPARIEAFAAVANAHPDFTLYVRDHESLLSARRHVECHTRLMPDSAFALGMQVRGAADGPLLMLLREDDEARDHGHAFLPHAIVADWLQDDPCLATGTSIAARTHQAEARVARGLRLLSRGERVVTDRLHAHILCLLLGIPHVALDNDYGKLGRYIEAWTAASPLLRRATTLAEAARLLDLPA